MLRMALKTLSAANAAKLDQDLMSAAGAYSVDQLMELAGLSVSQAVYAVAPPARAPRVLIVCGPGNNGGDGLVAARHLHFYGYRPTVCYPKRGRAELYGRLARQLENLGVPVLEQGFGEVLADADQVVDAVFGFSFSGEIREPFPGIVKALEETKLPVTSVDAPSSWNIETGPPEKGSLGATFMPSALVSLTAPKPLTKHFTGRHFIGGRFLPEELAKKYGLDPPPYEGIQQIVEVDQNGHKL